MTYTEKKLNRIAYTILGTGDEVAKVPTAAGSQYAIVRRFGHTTLLGKSAAAAAAELRRMVAAA